MSMAVKNIDVRKGVVRYPITKTKSFEMPLSIFQIELLQKRIEQNVEEFGMDCSWLFPSVTSKSGHIEEEKLIASEAKLFAEHWSPHTLRHSWITNADQKIRISDTHQRALTNHKPRRSNNGDAHAGYIHPDLDDLRVSQQRMTDYLLTQIKPKPGKRKKSGQTQ
jgi:integrase